MDMNIGYKVVCDLDDLVSAFISSGRVKYSIDKQTVPNEKCGPLCLFDTYRAAHKWREKMFNDYRCRIFRCEYEPSDAEYVWNRLENKCITELPDETVLANSITLKSEMRDNFDELVG